MRGTSLPRGHFSGDMKVCCKTAKEENKRENPYSLWGSLSWIEISAAASRPIEPPYKRSGFPLSS